jgi:hypothetical protein
VADVTAREASLGRGTSHSGDPTTGSLLSRSSARRITTITQNETIGARKDPKLDDDGRTLLSPIGRQVVLRAALVTGLWEARGLANGGLMPEATTVIAPHAAGITPARNTTTAIMLPTYTGGQIHSCVQEGQGRRRYIDMYI